jgi:NPCBM/NEW2 domain
MPAKITRPILLMLLFGGAVHAQGPARFTIETAEETHKASGLIALAETRALTIIEAGRRRTLERWIELRREGQTLPALLNRNFALLTNGDRIPLEPAASVLLQDGRLLLRCAKTLPGAPEKAVSLYAPHVAVLFWSLPDGIDDADSLIAKIQREVRKRDVIYLKNGDRIEGTIAAMTDKTGCVSVNEGRNTATPWANIAGIAWNTDRQARLRTKKSYFRVVLDGGARVNFLDLRFDEKTLRWLGTTQFGTSLDMPESAVLAIDERQGQAVDLSDLTYTRYEHRPYLGASWPLVLDAGVTGHPLSLAGNAFEKGLGTHASCSVSYKLEAQYQRFDSIVGIDPERAPRGRARIALEIDGKRIDLNAGKEMTARDAPLQIRLDVRGVRTLKLIVETGSFGDVQAEVNWAKARLIKRDE